MPKVVKEFLLDESTGNVTVEFNDDSTATLPAFRFQIA